MKRFEELDHTADRSFRAYGSTLPELFENAALALFSLEEVQAGLTAVTREVEVRGIDYESLLVNWLSELLYLQETQAEAYDRFAVEQLEPIRLKARITGSSFRQIAKPVKAITYHNLKIERAPGGWEATVVVDV